ALVGLLAKHELSQAHAATSHCSLSTRNLIEPALMETFCISAAMSVASTRQLKICCDISGANKNPCEPNENEDSALRSSGRSTSMLVACSNLCMALFASIASLISSFEKLSSVIAPSCLVCRL